ncbi:MULTISPECIES: gamma-glutamyl-gamma-aminobutyrate hydrolase family protein [unclassified Streptomyces]|uniref:gamma-glutamyl-gamma-aminobutyrate hydrolase family protein n=1 Tax=unclassified Streptomyces TaxID=2593676 RepID=UPI00225B2E67|nr:MULTISPECIES: gamma-glutamyl-gamma-aminobutyrate hydrolase family protein [unclassified Streptomyces]WSP53754.1 gamma-glutamyl-gamma-aminobutyrate hydrolase family protein [Streptomyces sp. NBC_01241]WSU25578.1 gamma-glutamyl-gamma-aminobutyrate hydrolase family protein [Streptomyces sp. NBC_01108]MCX4785157.1 gamma-glutamyl-gamma-aminobutyrate hydrolase family protein [Streptomyces sp. NBC_01221]MCX4798902.1 gamma-glutamyl-gamma-aminobutyrate hydrolase family protein [Streptomyces sp. NBC_0
MTRPLIAIPARFCATTSALRYAAEVNARALVEAVWRAGGEPATIHPADPAEEDVAARLARFDAVLLPGGGDIAPYRYGAADTHDSVYDVDGLQDAFDIEAARRALQSGMPLLAICRGLQVVNVALGGSLQQDMGGPGHEHRHLLHPVAIRPGTRTARALGADKLEASCYHHQRTDRLGDGLTATATAGDGTIEALELPSAGGWFVAVQWHPEDTAHQDPFQQNLFDTLVRHARSG